MLNKAIFDLAQHLPEPSQKRIRNFILKKVENVTSGCQEIIVLEAVSSSNKIPVIKAIRSVSGLGLKEAKEISESDVPFVVPYKGDVQAAYNILLSAGCRMRPISV